MKLLMFHKKGIPVLLNEVESFLFLKEYFYAAVSVFLVRDNLRGLRELCLQKNPALVAIIWAREVTSWQKLGQILQLEFLKRSLIWIEVEVVSCSQHRFTKNQSINFYSIMTLFIYKYFSWRCRWIKIKMLLHKGFHLIVQCVSVDWSLW